ncbi:hypothetical protein KPL70_016260 [Citrus sinensis]|nr:hypothetical protein KPL70_016260 [Citrus sinensis]
MAIITLANGLKTLFCVLGCVMTATLTWMAATLVDFFINVVPLACTAARDPYKNSVIGLARWTVLCLLIYFVIATDLGYLQGIKLDWCNAMASLHVPTFLSNFSNCHLKNLYKIQYTMLYCGIQAGLRHFTAASVAESVPYNHKDSLEHEGKSSSVVIARIVFSVLGFLMLGTLIYTLLTDGSPFRKELLTPWMIATLIDFYINVAALSVWVAYKESSWVGAFFWIILFICLGSITTCAYIVLQLFRLSSQDPIYLVLFNSGNRQVSETCFHV